MADDIRLVIAVEDKGLLKAIANTESLESKVKKLSSAYGRGATTYGRYDRALAQLAKSTGKSVQELRDYGTALRANEKATKKAAAEAKALAAEKKKEIAIAKQLAAEKKAEAQELARSEAAYKKLRASMDPAFAAQQRLIAQIEVLDSALERGIITKDEYNLALQRVRANSNLASSGLDKFGNAVVRSKNKMSYGSMVAQQFGYQIGDFFVQVQSGQNILVAFAQQGTQLAGLLPGIAGAVVGIGLAASTMVAGLFRAGNNASDLDEALKSARDTAKDLSQEVGLLASGLEDAAEWAFLRQVRLAQAEVDKLTSKTEDFEQQASVGTGFFVAPVTSEEMQSTGAEVSAAERALEIAKEEYENYLRVRGLKEVLAQQDEDAITAAEAYAASMERSRKAREEALKFAEQERISQRQSIALQTMINAYGANSVEVARLRNAIEFENYKNRLKEAEVTEELATQLLDALSTAQDLAIVDMEAGIVAARDEAAGLARELGISLGLAQALVNLSSPVILDPRDPNYNRARALQATRFGFEYNDQSSSAFYNPPETEEGGGGASQRNQAQEALDKLREQYEVKQALIDATETEATLIKALGADYKSVYGAKTIADLTTMIEQVNALTEASERQKEISDMVGKSFGDALMGIVDGTKSVKDAFKSMASDIIKELYRVLVVERLVKSVSGFVGGLFPSANGNVFSGGNVIPFANGGVVGSPTMFPMSGGRTGLMGEAGPEAIMPLKRGSDGKLGVEANGGGNVTVIQNFNIAANGDESVKRIVRAETPRMAEAAKAAVLDSKRRGGAYGRSF